MTLHLPKPETLDAIVAQDRVYYWSGLLELLLSKHGILASERQDTGVDFFPRGVDEGASQSHSVIEAPLSAKMMASLGLKGKPVSCERLSIEDKNGKKIGNLEYPVFEVRAIPRERGEVSESYVFRAEDPLLDNRVIHGQVFDDLGGWKVEAFGITETGKRFPLIISSDSKILITFQVFDVILASHYRPRLEAGFYSTVSKANCADLEMYIFRELMVRCVEGFTYHQALWPHGSSCALSLRLDYDRAISDESCQNLLDLCDECGVRVTIFFMLHLMPHRQIGMFLDRGHEISIHSVAVTWAQFRKEYFDFICQTGINPRGYTCHGGIGAPGHLGETQHDWAERLGMLYGEMLGFPSCRSYPALAYSSGQIKVRPLILPPNHLSLDLGTSDDANALDDLLERVPSDLSLGKHVIIMNHPDIHRSQLAVLLRSLKDLNFWSPTFEDTARLELTKMEIGVS